MCNRLRWILLPPLFVVMGVGNTIITLLAITGLSQAQQLQPHAFDGSKLFSYNSLWLGIEIWIPISMAFLIISFLSLILNRFKVE